MYNRIPSRSGSKILKLIHPSVSRELRPRKRLGFFIYGNQKIQNLQNYLP